MRKKIPTTTTIGTITSRNIEYQKLYVSTYCIESNVSNVNTYFRIPIFISAIQFYYIYSIDCGECLTNAYVSNEKCKNK